MSPKPREVEVYSPINPLWLHSLRWLNDAHYDLKVGVDDLQTNCRVIANGQFLCHLIPSALSSHERQEFFPAVPGCRKEQGPSYSPTEDCWWRTTPANEGWHPER